MMHEPATWESLLVSTAVEPRYRHGAGCGGVVSIWRSRSGAARDRAYCDKCGNQWHRPDARYRWKEGSR